MVTQEEIEKLLKGYEGKLFDLTLDNMDIFVSEASEFFGDDKDKIHVYNRHGGWIEDRESPRIISNVGKLGEDQVTIDSLEEHLCHYLNLDKKPRFAFVSSNGTSGLYVSQGQTEDKPYSTRNETLYLRKKNESK